MIKIITISGVLYCDPTHILNIFKKNGGYYLTLVIGTYWEKWEITEESFIFLTNGR